MSRKPSFEKTAPRVRACMIKPNSTRREYEMTNIKARKHLRKLLGSFTNGAILHRLAELAVEEAIEARRKGNELLYQRLTLVEAGLPARLMVDCSHGNSSKDYRRQPEVAADLGAQLINGNGSIFGVMMESHLVAGRQELKRGCALTYGQSITDACLGWEETVPVLRALSAAVRARRARGRAG